MRGSADTRHYPDCIGHDGNTFGCKVKNLAAVALGSIKTKKKAKASRENGKMGGRPLTFKADCGHLVPRNSFYKNTYSGRTACKSCSDAIHAAS